MWWKLLLLTVYLAVLFILSRILEAFSYCQSGYLASRLLDPLSLNVRKLKTLLDQRGVSYAGVVEKQDLTELVNASGEVNEGEVEAATALSEDAGRATNFTCGTHFYEEVEDTKDSVWLVQVVRDKTKTFMQQDDWNTLTKKVSRFGIRPGIFDCSLDESLCNRKDWFSSRLVMALPQGYRFKDNVVLRSYTGSTRVQAVLDWVNHNLASRIIEIDNVKQYGYDWFNQDGSYDDKKMKVRVILFSQMRIPAMFYSALSVKFTGRVKFGTVDLNTAVGEEIYQRMRDEHAVDKVPTFLVVTPEGNFSYGANRGEYLNYRSMALLFKSLHPEVNDIFLLSLILINVMCWLDLFIVSGNLFKRLGVLLWHIGKWNCMLILLWLPILGLFQLPYMDMVLSHAMHLLRVLSGTVVASTLRSDWLWYTSLHGCFLLCTFLVYAAVVGVLHYLYVSAEDEANNNNTEWWNLNWDGYMSYFFRPMSTLTRPMNTHEADLEVGMELLIERLAVPNFWLRPMISSDYIKDLPVWKYNGQTVESDIGSDNDSLRFESDDGDGADSGCDSPPLSPLGASPPLSPRKPYMFICEKCRALQQQSRALGSRENSRERERDNAESESACAKFLMDGDYKCLCQVGHDHPRPAHRHSRRSPKRDRHDTDRKSDDADHCSGGEFSDSEYQPPPGMLPCTECAICLEKYRFTVMLCGLPCGHSFHQQCIMGWLSRDNHCCPVCRWPTYKAKPCSIHLHAE